MNDIHALIDELAVKLDIPKSAKPAFQDVITGFCNAIPLPDEAPELFETARQESVVDFLRRVWKHPWIEQGTLTRIALRRLDPRCEVALRNWLRNERNRLPPDLHLPTKSETLTRELQDPVRVREAVRLAGARYLRKAAGLA